MPSERPKRRRGCLFAAGLLTSCTLAFVLVLGSLWWAQASDRLGSPDPSLNPIQRAVLTAFLMVQEPRLDQASGAADASVDLTVSQGTTATEVIDELVAAGVVDDGRLLRSYLRYKSLDRSIEAGNYYLEGGMTPRQIARALQSAEAPGIRLTVPEGWRREQIAESLPIAEIPITAQAFLAASETRPTGYSFTEALPPGGSLEGFLFPDTYMLGPETRADDMVRQMLDNFESKVGAPLRRGYDAQGLTLYHAVILASIVEREAVIPEERPAIAAVFINRLAAGMKLEADPTVQYALGRQPGQGWWKSPLNNVDLAFQSRYNTYLHPGLPPGPIANPGLDSLEAVAFPDSSDYLYFRAACDASGRHVFAETFEEHVANACP